jgi:pimeloyl-ACP methyl ester carboxylesterase
VFKVGAETLAATKVYADSGREPSVISFHGFGTTATRTRIRYMLDHLAGHGVSSACFDFSGNGDSTGELDKATLNLRRDEAHAAAKFLGRPEGSLAIIGTSMGAYLAALLSPVLRPRSLILISPAAYPEDAMELKLTEDFPKLARRPPGAYVGSPAFEALRTFEGDLLVITGGKDEVLPEGVTQLYAESAPSARSRKVIRLEESGHKVHPWLQEHAEERANVLREVLAVTREE